MLKQIEHSCFVLLFVVIAGTSAFAQHDFTFEEIVLDNVQFDPDYRKSLFSNESDTLFYLLLADFSIINSNTVYDLYAIKKHRNDTYEKPKRFIVSFQSLPDSIANYKQKINYFQIDSNHLYTITGSYFLSLQLKNDTFKYANAWKLPYPGYKFHFYKDSQTINVLKNKSTDSSISIFKYSLPKREKIRDIEIALNETSLFFYNKTNIFLGETHIAIGDFINYEVYIISAEGLNILDTIQKREHLTNNKHHVDSAKSKFRGRKTMQSVRAGHGYYERLPAIRKLTINSNNQLCILFNEPGNLYRLDIFSLDENEADISWSFIKSYYGVQGNFEGLNKDNPIDVLSFPLKLNNHRELVVEGNKIIDLLLTPEAGLKNTLQGKPIRYYLSGEYINSQKELQYAISVYKF